MRSSSPNWRTTVRSCYGTSVARTPTEPSAMSPGSSTRTATCSGSCPIRSTQWIRWSVRPTAPSSSARWSTLLDCRLPRSSRPHPTKTEDLRQRRLGREGSSQALHVANAQRNRTSPRGATGRVREADESLSSLPLEQLDDRREALVARALVQRQLLDERRFAPGSVGFRGHHTTVAAEPSRVGYDFEPNV